jgi:hypothetical protein
MAFTLPAGITIGSLHSIYYALLGLIPGVSAAEGGGGGAAGGSPITITRPADTTPYDAGDVVGATAAAISFPSLGPAAGRIMITSVALEMDVTAIPAGMTSFRLHLYNVTPPSALADKAAWDLPAGDRASYLGYIDLGSPADLGSTLYVQADKVNKQVLLAGTGLFGYLVTTAGYTPASEAVHRVTLNAVVL